MSLTAASLFAGIGGFDLAAREVGIRTVLAAEIDPTGRAVLRAQFPDAQLVEDATKADVRGVDLVMGGFPCQGLSAAASTPGGQGLLDPDSPSAVVWAALGKVFDASPEYLLLENADSLGTARFAEDMQALQLALEQRDVLNLNAGCFGSLMRRPRTFVLARRRPWARPEVEQRVSWTCAVDGIGVSNQQGGALFCAQPSVTRKSRSYTLLVTPDEVRSVTPEGVERLFGFPVGWTKAAGTETARYERLGNAVSVHAARAALSLLVCGGAHVGTPREPYTALLPHTIPAPGGTAGSAFGRIVRATVGARNVNSNVVEARYCTPVYEQWMQRHHSTVTPKMWEYLRTARAHGLVAAPRAWPTSVDVVMTQRG